MTAIHEIYFRSRTHNDLYLYDNGKVTKYRDEKFIRDRKLVTEDQFYDVLLDRITDLRLKEFGFIEHKEKSSHKVEYTLEISNGDYIRIYKTDRLYIYLCDHYSSIEFNNIETICEIQLLISLKNKKV